MQDRFASIVEDLELERGVKGSRLKHERVQRFYGNVKVTNIKKIQIPAPVAKEGMFSTKQETAEEYLIRNQALFHQLSNYSDINWQLLSDLEKYKTERKFLDKKYDKKVEEIQLRLSEKDTIIEKLKLRLTAEKDMNGTLSLSLAKRRKEVDELKKELEKEKEEVKKISKWYEEQKTETRNLTVQLNKGQGLTR
jgi:hypothetical protein